VKRHALAHYRRNHHSRFSVLPDAFFGVNARQFPGKPATAEIRKLFSYKMAAVTHKRRQSRQNGSALLNLQMAMKVNGPLLIHKSRFFGIDQKFGSKNFPPRH
jgi:hypothetical protein